MPAALAITCDGWAAEDLRALARSSRDAEWTARLPAIALVLDGAGREAAGRAVGVDRQAVRDWVVRRNAEGPDGLRNRPRPGRACRLTDAQLAMVRGWMESGPDPAADGVSRWRTCDIRQKIGAACTDEGVRRLLRRLGFRRVSGRPEHPRGGAAARAGFRSAFGALARDCGGAEAVRGGGAGAGYGDTVSGRGSGWAEGDGIACLGASGFAAPDRSRSSLWLLLSVRGGVRCARQGGWVGLRAGGHGGDERASGGDWRGGCRWGVRGGCA